MPQRKSAASLKNLCLESALRNLNSIQHEAKYLAKPLIDDLYDKFRKHYLESIFSGKVDLPPPFPTDLFIHSRRKIIHSLDYFDQPVNEVANKINRFCKNLRNIRLEKHIDYLSLITINNPHILEIDLDCSNCTDHHLFIISEHCPELRYLSLIACDLVTEEGINFLPKRLQVLFLPYQITLKVQLNALERLSHLKRLRCQQGWNGILKTYAESLESLGNKTYEIEEMDFSIDQPTTYNIPQTLKSLFPKLRKVSLLSHYALGSNVAAFFEGIDCNLLTCLDLNVSADFIQVAAHLFPMLETLRITVISENQAIDVRYLEIPKNIPFQHLRGLYVCDQNSKLSTNNFKLLLMSCHGLEFLTINNFNQLSDQVLYDVLASNPLKCVRYVDLDACGPMTIQSLCVLLESLTSLTRMNIYYCSNLSHEDGITAKQLIAKMNWEIEFYWDRENEREIVFLTN